MLAQQPPDGAGDTQSPDPATTARVPTFNPTSGSPGTMVQVETLDLPAVTPVYLGMGATRSSFEVLTQLVTDENGSINVTVPVPPWATSDRTHFFVIVDVYFRPLAVSAGYYVTDTEGTLARRGVVVEEDGCLTLREQGQQEQEREVYALSGEGTQDLRSGQEVLLEGTLASTSDCPGTPLRVTRVVR